MRLINIYDLLKITALFFLSLSFSKLKKNTIAWRGGGMGGGGDGI